MTLETASQTLFSSAVVSLLLACSGSDGLPLDASGGATVGNGGSANATGSGGSANPVNTGGATNQANGGRSAGGEQGLGGSVVGGASNGGSSSGGSATGGNANGGTSNGGSTTGGAATGGKAAGGASIGGAATGGKAAGGASTGGAPTGGKAAGGASTGGAATGGIAAGGASTGGAATGGKAVGGAATGGVATGGKATGGAATGGAATGGKAATGGAATGGNSTSTGTCPTALGNGTCPAKSCPSGASDCGCYNVAGLGVTKKEILDAGGDTRFLASAMVETENLKADYTLGDGKTGDAFNAGRCKQNWYMIRQCHPAWNSLGASSYTTSAAMNSDLKLDIQVYNECRAKWSESVWFAGHRNGQTGLTTGTAPNLALFIAAYNWTKTNLENGHLCDNVRFWVTVPAIVVD